MSKWIEHTSIKFRNILSLVIAIPFSCILLVLFPVYKIKLMRLCSDRIGHYSMNTELLLCYLDTLKTQEKNIMYLFYLLDASVCNTQLHVMWKRIIVIIPFQNIAAYTNRCLTYILGDRYKNDALKKFENALGAQDTSHYLQNKTRHLYFTENELRRGEQLLSDLHIPVGARYVCLLARDSTYLDQYFPGKDWSYHYYRDCDIKNFSKAALFLAEKGYYVLRMGKTVAEPCDFKHSGVIDYARHPLRSDFADIYLSAHCDFFISTGSGLDGVAQACRKPIVFVNLVPFENGLPYWYPAKLFIFKKILDKTNNSFVPLKKINELVQKNERVKQTLDNLNWSLIENSEDEILEVVQEMENVIRDQVSDNISDFVCPTLKKSPCCSIFSYIELLRSHPETCHIKVGKKFLNDNYFLFSE